MIHHLRTMTLGEFVKGFFALAAWGAAVYALFLIAWGYGL